MARVLENLKVRDKASETRCLRAGKSNGAIHALLTLVLLHQKVIAAVALHGIFAAARLPDALLCAAVGTDLWHGYRGILMKIGGFAKKNW